MTFWYIFIPVLVVCTTPWWLVPILNWVVRKIDRSIELIETENPSIEWLFKIAVPIDRWRQRRQDQKIIKGMRRAAAILDDHGLLPTNARKLREAGCVPRWSGVSVATRGSA